MNKVVFAFFLVLLFSSTCSPMGFIPPEPITISTDTIEVIKFNNNVHVEGHGLIGTGKIWLDIKKDDFGFISGNKTCLFVSGSVFRMKIDNTKQSQLIGFNIGDYGVSSESYKTFEIIKTPSGEANIKNKIFTMNYKYLCSSYPDKYRLKNLDDLNNRTIRIGLTSEEFLVAWRAPNDINKSVGSWGVHEQWIYNDSEGMPKQYFYFENGILTSWQD